MKKIFNYLVKNGVSRDLANAILNDAVGNASKHFNLVDVLETLGCQMVITEYLLLNVTITFTIDNMEVKYQYPMHHII